MILIVSVQTDEITNATCRYLNLYKIDYVRINAYENVIVRKIEIYESKVNFIIEHYGRAFCLSEIDFVWYRNGYLFNGFIENLRNSIGEEKDVLNFHYDEISILNYFLFSLFEGSKMLGSFSNGIPNKIMMLQSAMSIGFNVPYTFISTLPNEISLAFNKRIVVKPLKDFRGIRTGNLMFNPYTAELLEEDLKYSENETIFPALFQELIKPLFEVKCFVFYGKVFSIAIFRSVKSFKQDWRSQDEFQDTNRYVPYTLQEPEKGMLLNLFRKNKLNTGTADFIVSDSYKFYFLEINPAGQYFFINRIGNYNIEKHLAKKLGKYVKH
jgi:hypothetical protein